MAGPLEGTRVVELGVWVAGPGAGGLLADWGADVVKIEPPAGDPARQFAGMLGGDLPFNPPFELDNRGKRGIVIDLTIAEGRGVALGLLEKADVFLTNVRLAGLERLGLDHGRLLEQFPGLIYAAITGYGMDGPDSDRPTFDIGAYWARSGVAGLLTAPGAGSIPPFQRGGMGDHQAAMTMAGAVCAALVARARTGKGQFVTTSLLRQGIYSIGFDLNVALRFGVPLAVNSRDTMGNPIINSYRDTDGRWFWLIGLEADRHWPNLARAVGHPEWIDDFRYSSAGRRRHNCRELITELDQIFARRGRDEWGPIFDAHDVWWAPVQSSEEVLADPQAWAAGAFVEVPDGAGSATMVASPADFSATPWAPRAMPPELGQHTEEVLAELGYDASGIDRLRAAGAVG